jgi:WD40 repeat protein
MRDWTVITEQTSLIYFTVDSLEQYALCTTRDQGLHLWDLQSRSLLRTLIGSKHGDYVIFSCFGGHDDQFVATGSEGIVSHSHSHMLLADSCVYIWNRGNERPIAVLEGHSAVVNAVSWNPVDPTMLASCSDDGTVRIWTAVAASS